MVIGSWSKLDIAKSQILPISMAESGFGEQETPAGTTTPRR
jgi:hypothetical protein